MKRIASNSIDSQRMLKMQTLAQSSAFAELSDIESRQGENTEEEEEEEDDEDEGVVKNENLVTKDTIKSQVNLWLQNEESLKSLKSQMNQIRKNQKTVSNHLFSLLNNANLDKVSLASGGSIVPIESVVHKAHSKTSLMQLLLEKVFQNEADKEIKAAQLTKLIYDSRPTTTKQKIERKKK